MRSTTTSFPQLLDFVLPKELEAGEPPEERGLARDGVKLMVSHFTTDRITHTRFYEMYRYLLPGDVLVLNTSGTLNAALRVTRADGTRLRLHLSTHIGEDQWTVELRLPGRQGTTPFLEAVPGEVLRLARGGTATLLRPYIGDRPALPEATASRLWVAELSLREDWLPYLERYGVAHSLWLCYPGLAVRLLSDGLRDRARQRRDAVRGPRLYGYHHQAIASGCPSRAAAPAYGSGQPGRSRTAVRGVFPRASRNGAAGQRDPRGGQRVSPWARPSCARWRRSAMTPVCRTRAKDGPIWSLRRSVACVWWMAC